MTNAFFYVVGYLALMAPTYVLPYFGSNSIIANSIGAAVGRGMTPFWWFHAWALVMLVLMAFVRGKRIGKPYLLVFPIIAAAFDMTPGLTLVPFVPTVMHLLALVLGAMGNVQPSGAGDATAVDVPQPMSMGALVSAAVMTIATVLGSVTFAVSAKNTLNSIASKPPALLPSPKLAELPHKPSAPTEAVTSLSGSRLANPQPKKMALRPSTERTSPPPPTQMKPDAPQKSRYINLND